MKTVLVVDDNVDLSSNIKYMLSKSGYTVFVAHDGLEGIAMAKEKLPDLIIMDLMLPGIQGAQAVGMIKKYPPCKNIPVIFLTGLMSGQEKREGVSRRYRVNGQQYPAIAKPFDFPELLKTIENISSFH